MKKLFLAILAIMLLSCSALFYGCADTSTPTDDETPEVVDVMSEKFLYDFETFKLDLQLIKVRENFGAIDLNTNAEFVKNGGSIVASGESGFKEIGIDIKGPSEYDLDFISCKLDEIVTPFLSYTKAYVSQCDGEVLAKVHEPYFNRTFRHFCGHKNTPFKPEAASYPALVKNGNVIYFAHPVFSAYNKSGNYVLERYIKNGIEKTYNKNIKLSYYPSCARIRMRKSDENCFYAIHMLYAPPVNRGNVCLLEDFPPLYNTEMTVKIPEKVKSITLVPQGKELEFTQKGDEVSFCVDKMELHQLIVVKY